MTAGSCLEGVRDRRRDEDGDGGTRGQRDRCRDGWRDEEHWVPEDGQTDEVRPEEGKGLGGSGWVSPICSAVPGRCWVEKHPNPFPGDPGARRPRRPPPRVPRHLGTPASQALVSPSAVPTLDLLGSCPTGMIPGDAVGGPEGAHRNFLALKPPPGCSLLGWNNQRWFIPEFHHPLGWSALGEHPTLGWLTLGPRKRGTQHPWGGEPQGPINPWAPQAQSREP